MEVLIIIKRCFYIIIYKIFFQNIFYNIQQIVIKLKMGDNASDQYCIALRKTYINK